MTFQPIFQIVRTLVSGALTIEQLFEAIIYLSPSPIQLGMPDLQQKKARLQQMRHPDQN